MVRDVAVTIDTVSDIEKHSLVHPDHRRSQSHCLGDIIDASSSEKMGLEDRALKFLGTEVEGECVTIGHQRRRDNVTIYIARPQVPEQIGHVHYVGVRPGRPPAFE